MRLTLLSLSSNLNKIFWDGIDNKQKYTTDLCPETVFIFSVWNLHANESTIMRQTTTQCTVMVRIKYTWVMILILTGCSFSCNLVPSQRYI